MNLARMQDIGGCRAVVRTPANVRSVVQKYRDGLKNDPRTLVRTVLAREADYIKEPKEDGYRGVHLIMKYQTDSPSKKTYQGYSIEIQVRTQMQHAWATAVETAQTFTGQALKTQVKKANTDWLRFFALAGSLFALQEKQPCVPGTPSDRAAIIREMRDLNQKERIITHLQGYDLAVHEQEADHHVAAHFFLLILDAEKRTLNIRGFGKKEAEQAEADYLRVERQTINDPQKNAVLVSVDSIKALRRAYPNYYVDSSRFVDALSKELDDK